MNNYMIKYYMYIFLIHFLFQLQIKNSNGYKKWLNLYISPYPPRLSSHGSSSSKGPEYSAS